MSDWLSYTAILFVAGSIGIVLYYLVSAINNKRKSDELRFMACAVEDPIEKSVEKEDTVKAQADIEENTLSRSLWDKYRLQPEIEKLYLTFEEPKIRSERIEDISHRHNQRFASALRDKDFITQIDFLYLNKYFYNAPFYEAIKNAVANEVNSNFPLIKYISVGGKGYDKPVMAGKLYEGDISEKFNVSYLYEAIKYIHELPSGIKHSIIQKMSSLSESKTPLHGESLSKFGELFDDVHRIEVEDYSIGYSVKEKTITVLAIGKHEELINKLGHTLAENK